METLNAVDVILSIVLTLFVIPFVGALVMGIDRKITARIQGRYGPPVLQPIYDVIKLLKKESVLLNTIQILYAYLHLAFMVLTVLFILLGQDLLMILFVLAFSTISLILGGMCVYSLAMDEPDLFDVFVHPLHHAGIRYMIVGSVASIHYGEPRLTMDVDLVVQLQEPEISTLQINQFLEIFRSAGFDVKEGG
jgi:formate hydrogenlyase subunit 4